MITKEELKTLVDARHRLDEVVSMFCYCSGLCDKHNFSGGNRGMVAGYQVIYDWENPRKKDQDCVVVDITHLSAGGDRITYHEKFPLRLLHANKDANVVYNNWVAEVEEWARNKQEKREAQKLAKDRAQYEKLKTKFAQQPVCFME